MPKKIEDIIPSGKKSIRNIPVPIRKMDSKNEASKIQETPKIKIEERPNSNSIRPEIKDLASRYSNDSFTQTESSNISKKKLPTWIWVAVGLVIFIGGFFAFSNGATFSYKPKKISLAFVNDVYIAKQNPEKDELSYSVIKLSLQKEVTAPSTGEENVSEKAKGKVVVYNEQASPQQLIKTTRLESPDGKIFRIEEDITIPAKGSIEVLAVADQVGEEYNIGLSDFTVPGFKSSPTKFKQVFARSKTPMAGGFVGVRKKISPEKLIEIKNSLEESIKTELLAKAGSQVPEGFIMFSNLVDISYELLPIENSGEGQAKVTLRGDLNTYIFKNIDFASFLANNKKKNSDNLPVAITDLSQLNVSLIETSSGTSTSSLKISLLGSLNLVSITDENALASSLAGKSKNKSELGVILKNYPTIDDAEWVVRPFWKSSFPKDPADIKIEKL